jgi:PAS domain S-box-containing protein
MVMESLVPLATLFAGVVCAAAIVAFWSHRSEPGALGYVFVLAGVVIWALSYGFSLFVTDPGVHTLLLSISWVVKGSIPLAWLVFALEYTGRGEYISRGRIALLGVVPTFSVLLMLTNDLHGLAWKDFEVVVTNGLAVATFDFGPIALLAVGYAYLLIGAGMALLLEMLVFDRAMYGLQSLVFIVATLVPMGANLQWVLRLAPVPGLDLTPLSFAVSIPVVGYALYALDLFENTPATRRAGQRAAIEDFVDGVLLVDTEGHVIELNETARTVLGVAESEVLVNPIEELLGVDEFDLDREARTIDLRTPEGRRDFDVTASTITDRRDSPIGYTVVMHDVTEEKHRRQRLEVLNRILRHNLRNTMTTVIGHAQYIGYSGSDESAELAQKIQDRSNQLVTLSEKAREIDRVMDQAADRADLEADALLERIERRVTDTQDDPICVAVEAPTDLGVTTNRVIIEEVLRYAAESLLSHNDRPKPRLSMRAATAEANRPWVEFTLRDDGAGIPATERAIIDEGTETPLKHSHDLDLWLVNWGVETLGGELSFIDVEDGADRRPGIVITLPDLSRTDRPATR